MKKVVILGAAGRDFHDFNVLFRNNPDYLVVAFTATQIPDIAGRRYPAALAGQWYPEGIPIIELGLRISTEFFLPERSFVRSSGVGFIE